MSATNKAVATVTNAMTIAGLEMLRQPDLNHYCTNAEDRVAQSRAKKSYRVKAIKRVLSSELMKDSVRKGDPEYFLIVSRFKSLPDDTFLDAVETLPIVGSRAHERKDVITMGNLSGFKL